MTASTEVVDAVQQLLESEGVLQSIRAQLRSSVINALTTRGEKKQTKAVEFLSKENGRESMLLIMDLLVKLNLNESLSVFEAETGLVSTSLNGNDFLSKLKINSTSDNSQPIIHQLVEYQINHLNSSNSNDIPSYSADTNNASKYENNLTSFLSSPQKELKTSLIPVLSSRVSHTVSAPQLPSYTDRNQKNERNEGSEKNEYKESTMNNNESNVLSNTHTDIHVDNSLHTSIYDISDSESIADEKNEKFEEKQSYYAYNETKEKGSKDEKYHDNNDENDDDMLQESQDSYLEIKADKKEINNNKNNNKNKTYKKEDDEMKNEVQKEDKKDKEKDEEEEELMEELEEDIEEEVLKREAESDSSASFSIEYGQVSANDNGRNTADSSNDKYNDNYDNNNGNSNKDSNGDREENNGNKVRNKYNDEENDEIEFSIDKIIDTNNEKNTEKDDKKDFNISEEKTVGVKRLGQGSVSRSKSGWNNDNLKEENEFDFKDDAMDNLEDSLDREENQNAFKKLKNHNNEIVEETLNDKNSFNSHRSDIHIPPVVRSSWGNDNENANKNANNANNKNDRKDDSDNDNNSIESLVDDDESLEEDGDDSKDELSNNNTSGSLFMPRTRSGALPLVTPMTTCMAVSTSDSLNIQKNKEKEDKEDLNNQANQFNKSNRSSNFSYTNSINNSNDISNNDDLDNNSAEFDVDADYSKDENIYLSSNSSKLSDVERKIAEMEKDNEDFKRIRINEEKNNGDNDNDKNDDNNDIDDSYNNDDDYNGGNNNSKINGNNGKNNDNNDANGDTEDYSEGDFEIGDEDEDLQVNESVASNDIEAMEMSVGVADSGSDGSFSGLNSENSKNNKNNLDSKQSIWQNNSTQKIDDKNSISNKKDNGKSTGKNKEKDVEDLDFSQSISDSADLDFSVSETEISGSKSGIDNNKDNYDFTAAVIPPKGKPGPRDRTATGW